MTQDPASGGAAVGDDQITLFQKGRDPSDPGNGGPPTTSRPAVYLDESTPGIASIVFAAEAKPVNILTRDVMERLGAIIGSIRAATHLRGVVVKSALTHTFIVGADVNAIARITDPAEGEAAAKLGQETFTVLSELHVPVVAAINGLCLGGGAELALACHYRVATDHPSVRIGLPEVRLGILPGFGGTQRLPRLVGLKRGLDLILTSRNVDARRARRMGLVDVIIPDAIFDTEVVHFIERAAAGAPPARRVPVWTGTRAAQKRRAPLSLGDRFLESPIGRPLLFKLTERQVVKTTRRHYDAPFDAMVVMKQGWGRPLAEGLDIEARALGRRLASEEKEALVHVFFLSEANRRDKGVSGDARPLTIERAALLGAGTMGGGIAHLLSHRDIQVRMKDLNDEALLGGMRAAAEGYRRQVKRRRIRKSEADRKLSLIRPTADYSGFGRVDIVFEAVVEKMSVKQTVLREVEGATPAHTVFASNTSALSITELQQASRRPDKVAGFHFFNPVHRMPLVEVIRGEQTSDETVVTLMTLARRLGKTPILCKDAPGFLVNRILGRYLNEASHLLAEGVPIDRCDAVAVAFGMPMGPIRLIDEIGVDVAAKVATILGEGLGERYQTNNLLERVLGDERLGKKVGRGFYRYRARSRWRRGGPRVDPGVVPLVETGGRTFSGTDREIRDRLVFVMVDEATRCLDEGVVRTPGDVDLGMVFGTGFPPFRGGLLAYADGVGLRTVAETLTRFSETVAPRFRPCDRLKEMSAQERRFFSG